jgi:hypothetical protein
MSREKKEYCFQCQFLTRHGLSTTYSLAEDLFVEAILLGDLQFSREVLERGWVPAKDNLLYVAFTTEHIDADLVRLTPLSISGTKCP